MAAVVILILVGLFLYGAATNEAYRWRDLRQVPLQRADLSRAVWNTLQLTVYSMVLAIVLGVILAVMRLSPNPVFRSVSWVYLWIFRGTPVYVQLVFWGLIPTIYTEHPAGRAVRAVVLPAQPAGPVDPVPAGDPRPGLNEAAYMAEIIRAGISSVPEGQLEASTALGMSWGMTMRRTVLPQAMRVIIPPTGNEVISMLKTTSLVTAVPFTLDLYGIATREIAAREFEPVPLLLVAAAWYLAGHQHPDGRPVLPGAVLLPGRLAQADHQTTRGAGQGAADRRGGGTYDAATR